MTPVVLVIDRATASTHGPGMIEELGGAWTESYQAWLKMGLPYLLMMAHTKQRLRLRAPLAAFITSDEGLQIGLQEFTSKLAGKTCQWVLLLAEGSIGMRITRHELQIINTTRGNA